MKGFFITGTDTDAGKTYVSSLILKALRQERVDVVGYKPICCGGREDAYALQEASGGDAGGALDLYKVNPFWARTPAAPYVAAMFEKKDLEIAPLIQGAADLAAAHDAVLVEGVGGWMVPITKEYMIADLAKDIGLPVILVVGNRLGTLNHTLLTVQSMRSAGIEPVGMVVNNLVDELDTATVTNKSLVEDLTGVPVLADVIQGQEEIEAWPFLELLEQ
ncbi:dethiobiotin synthase [Verrucomicrobiaceae bacterium N1E253]|uniref:ATP-dependent dethiobiotin synthetase BioD n=1 Tax=Oceaniferula marina TaxID=2748318 RepID=A0A851GL17_9BACT|nr:dethiobiotin synthase [Oceaniferula marina]NWK56531.1 dethiobiotin synthase [Oceaniferula marina]